MCQLKECIRIISRLRGHVSKTGQTQKETVEAISSLSGRQFFQSPAEIAQTSWYSLSHDDGGGIVRAARVPVSGRTRVATFIADVASHFWKGVTLAWVETNGQASVLISRDSVPRSTCDG
jgi:hypothetical protein